MESIGSVLVNFHLCAKTLKKVILKGKGFILGHSFRDFCSWFLGSVAFETVADQTSWQRTHGKAKMLTSCQISSKKGERARGHGLNVAFKCSSPVI